MNRETLTLWAWRLALGAAILVGILSWQTGVSFLESVIRMILAFALLYGLGAGGLFWFYKTAPFTEEPVIPKGAHLDIAVGLDSDPLMQEGSVALDKPEFSPQAYGGEAPVAGQVDWDLSQGLPDADKQAEIIRRMGWGE